MESGVGRLCQAQKLFLDFFFCFFGFRSLALILVEQKMFCYVVAYRVTLVNEELL